MGSTVSIPNPIVCVERLTIIFVYLSVECTEITTAFADTNRTFEYTVKRCIKNLFICLATTFYLNITQCFIPDLTSLFCQSLQIIIRQFTLQVFLGLFFAYKRNTIAQIYRFRSVCKVHYSTGITPFCFFLVCIYFAISQNTCFYRGNVRFYIQVNPRIILQLLITAHKTVTCLDSTVTRIDHHVYRLILLTIIYLIKSRLMRRCILHFNFLVIENHLIIIRFQLLIIIAISYNRTKFISLIRTQIESRTTTMTSHNQRKTFQLICCIIRPFGIDTKHTIRQVNSRESRHQQVTDISHVRIHIVHRAFHGGYLVLYSTTSAQHGN